MDDLRENEITSSFEILKISHSRGACKGKYKISEEINP